jgi:uncharacterized protein YndB with AHSA1/START domain
MAPQIELSVVLPVPREILYRAWLDGDEHSAFTGAPASSDPRVGGAFSAWDGYISGVTEELDAHVRIVQSWRTTAFPEDSEDSELEIVFEDAADGTRLLLRHSNIPPDQVASYLDGWKTHYFEPMRRYFEARTVAPTPVVPAKKPAAVKKPTAARKPAPPKKKPASPKKKAAAPKAAKAKAKKAAKKGAAPKKKPAGKKAARKKSARKPATRGRKAARRRKS